MIESSIGGREEETVRGRAHIHKVRHNSRPAERQLLRIICSVARYNLFVVTATTVVATLDRLLRWFTFCSHTFGSHHRCFLCRRSLVLATAIIVTAFGGYSCFLCWYNGLSWGCLLRWWSLILTATFVATAFRYCCYRTPAIR